MRGEPCRTWGAPVRANGCSVVYRVVDESLRYVHVYVPYAMSGAADAADTINFALDTRRPPLPREEPDNG